MMEEMNIGRKRGRKVIASVNAPANATIVAFAGGCVKMITLILYSTNTERKV
jgi:hypothetical protein